MNRVVLALGGNALGNTPDEQIKAANKAADALKPLLDSGAEVLICHGNGPQVGMINLAFEDGYNVGETPLMNLAECTAMSQGYIGYHLQDALNKVTNIESTTILTRCLVDKNDAGFTNPTKPIGSFYTKDEADQFTKETSFKFIEDSGRGYRRVVASPKPVEILEIETIKQVIDSGKIVIAGGGGGIPVIEESTGYTRADAVIDKDFCAELLAENIKADYLFILTAVEKVAINFGKPNEKWLSSATVSELDKYIAEGHFAPGSMLPKVQAAKKFVSAGYGNAVITSLDSAFDAWEGRTGTVITK
jgi:carbamate kinase